MDEKRKDVLAKIGSMDTWQLAQMAVVFRCLEELNEDDFAKFSDLVTIQNVPVFTAARRFDVVVMLDEVLSIPGGKEGEQA